MIAFYKSNLGNKLRNNLHIGIPVIGLFPISNMYIIWKGLDYMLYR